MNSSITAYRIVARSTVVAIAITFASLASAAEFKVADFGALGDGVHDDGPAIAAAFEAAKADGSPSIVVFEKKTYRLGNNPAAWHYFQMEGHEDLTVEGRGATLILSKANLGFHFSGGRNIKLRELTFDTDEPRFTQGEVVALDKRGTLDVRIMDGYPEPPDEAFLSAQGYRAHGGGGRHMIVFENGGNARNTGMQSDHLYIHNITRISRGVFRFHVLEDYLEAFKGVRVGNWISYGFNKLDLRAATVAVKNRSACTYAQIAADRVEHITFEDIDIFGSLNGGIRVSDMPGDVILRDVHIIRKPGTRNLLSIISDALHLMNIRGRLIVEDCVVEAPGDDCLNVGTLMERIVEFSREDPKTMTLCTTDNRYYYYTIRRGDRLQFLDTRTKRELGIATVTRVESSPRHRTHRILLDREVPNLDPSSARVLNLNQMTSSTILRNNTMKPFTRNAMLVRAQHMTVEGNQLDGSRGGVIGVNFTHSMGENARLRDVTITRNTLTGFQGPALVVVNPYRDTQGVPDARDLTITGNVFEVDSASFAKGTAPSRGSQGKSVITEEASPLSAPNVTYPPDGCRLITLHPHLDWEEVAGADRYEIEVARDATFTKIVDRDAVHAVIDWYVIDKRLSPGTYYWRVRATDTGGATGQWSPIANFEIIEPQHQIRVQPGVSCAELQAAVDRAAANSPARITFQRGTYRFDAGPEDKIDEHVFHLHGASDIIFDFNGSTILLEDPADQLYEIHDCQRITLCDFTFGRDPDTSANGTVKGVDVTAGMAEIEIQAGYREGTFPRDVNQFFLWRTDPNNHKQLHTDGPLVIFLNQARTQAAGSGRNRYFARGQHDFNAMKQLIPGDFVQLEYRRWPYARISHCQDVTVCNGSGTGHFAMGLNACSDVKVLHMKHVSEHDLPSGGSFLVKNNTRGPWMEHCRFGMNGDDFHDVTANTVVVSKAIAPADWFPARTSRRAVTCTTSAARTGSSSTDTTSVSTH